MSLEKMISTEPIKEKLQKLKQHMPNQKQLIYDFAIYFADILKPQIDPLNFVMAAELVLRDLERGVDGFTKQPIQNNLTCQPSIVYVYISHHIPDIAESVCSGDFANDVKKIYEKYNTRSKSP